LKKLFVLLQHKTKSSQQGYILFQVVMVLAIVVALCAVSLPSLSFLQQRLVRLEAEKLLLMFRYMQRTALAAGRDERIRIDVAAGVYEGAGHREVLPSGVRFGVIPGAQGPPANPSKALAAPVSYKGGEIVFYAGGTVQAGTVYLVDSKYQVMYAVSSAVSPLVHITLYRYNADGPTWTAV
jgi:hypothetical protein